MKLVNSEQRTVNRFKRFAFWSLFTGYWLLAGIGAVQAMGERVPTRSGYFVRVAIIPEARSVLLNVPGEYRLRTADAAQVLHEGRGLHGVEVTARPRGLQIGGLTVPGNGLHVEAERDGIITVNGQRVRGKVNILRLDDARLRVINRVDLEDYVAAVLVSEIPADWPLEALKAQAIASRTYAVHQAAERARLDFDLAADVSSQVYGGRSAERRRTNQAVDLTRGLILTHQGQIFPAFFHACCGGHTEAARELWQIELPPLAGRSCPFDGDTPHVTWTRAIPLSAVAAQLRTAGVDVGTLQHVVASGWTTSGRVRNIHVAGTRGATTVPAKTFRAALGSDLIKSTLMTLAVRDGTLHVKGRGWGHGVGLCQWGALGMARSGYSSTDILHYYYPGARIQPLPPVAPASVPILTSTEQP